MESGSRKIFKGSLEERTGNMGIKGNSEKSTRKGYKGIKVIKLIGTEKS